MVSITSSMPAMDYHAPIWLPGGQVQTIWAALLSRSYEGAKPQWRRERWASPDHDFIDVDIALPRMPTMSILPAAPSPENQPLLVLFHGLEGSSQSHYALAFAQWAQQQGLACAVPHFRGCGGEVNLQPRAYHSGDFEEIDWILRRFKAQSPQRKIIAVGVSLGGNALMRWAQEMGSQAAQIVSAVASVCSPLDLVASGQHIGRGVNRWIYTPMFLRTMKPKALERLALHPGLFDERRLRASKNLYEFDNVFTAPLHGFKNTDDYWTRASAKPRMADIQVPALALNALNDPFMPASSLPQAGQVGKHVTLWQPQAGGHVGFPQGRFPGYVDALPRAVGAWLKGHL